jgi:hypothetical protein
MALVHNSVKKRRNTGGILSIFGEIVRQIGGAGNGKAFNQRFAKGLISCVGTRLGTPVAL